MKKHLLLLAIFLSTHLSAGDGHEGHGGDGLAGVLHRVAHHASIGLFNLNEFSFFLDSKHALKIDNIPIMISPANSTVPKNGNQYWPLFDHLCENWEYYRNEVWSPASTPKGQDAILIDRDFAESLAENQHKSCAQRAMVYILARRLDWTDKDALSVANAVEEADFYPKALRLSSNCKSVPLNEKFACVMTDVLNNDKTSFLKSNFRVLNKRILSVVENTDVRPSQLPLYDKQTGIQVDSIVQCQSKNNCLILFDPQRVNYLVEMVPGAFVLLAIHEYTRIALPNGYDESYSWSSTFDHFER